MLHEYVPYSPRMASRCLCGVPEEILSANVCGFYCLTFGRGPHRTNHTHTMGYRKNVGADYVRRKYLHITQRTRMRYFTSKDPVGSLYIRLFKFVYRNKIHPPSH